MAAEWAVESLTACQLAISAYTGSPAAVASAARMRAIMPQPAPDRVPDGLVS
jgi:hypothetical protein